MENPHHADWKFPFQFNRSILKHNLFTNEANNWQQQKRDWNDIQGEKIHSEEN